MQGGGACPLDSEIELFPAIGHSISFLKIELSKDNLRHGTGGEREKPSKETGVENNPTI